MPKDKYTTYPPALQKKIDGVNKYFDDRKKEEERWANLTPAEQEAEIKEAERFNALSPGEQEAERKKESPPSPPPESPPPESPVGETVESLKNKVAEAEASLAKSETALATLRGKYEKEPAEMQRKINFLTEQLTLLQGQLLEATKKPVETPKTLTLKEALKDDIKNLEEDMAPEIVDKIVALEEKVLDLARQEAKNSISEVANRFDGRLALSAREQFDKDLFDVYPDWEKMWNTPDFQTFLEGDDGLTGNNRYKSLESAFKKLNSRIVIKAFDIFTNKKPAAAPVVVPANGAESSTDDKLKRRVSAPPSSSPGGPTPTKIPAVMSSEEAKRALVQLSVSYSRGAFRGTKEEYNKKYAELHAIAIGTPAG